MLGEEVPSCPDCADTGLVMVREWHRGPWVSLVDCDCGAVATDDDDESEAAA